MSLLVKWMESLSIDVSITERCLLRVSRKSSCRSCVDACEHSALAIVDQLVTVDTSKCDSCGGCFSACPVSAITGSMPKRQSRNGLLIYESHYCPSVKELLIYRKQGIKGFMIPTGWQDDRWVAVIEEANSVLLELNLEPFCFQLAEELSEQTISRRELLFSAKNKGKSLAQELTPAAWRVNSDGWSLPAAFPEFQFYQVELDTTKCSLCQACFRLCSQQVFQISDSELVIDHQKCTDCALCEDICPEDAIVIRNMVREKSESRVAVVKSRCNRCKQQFYAFAGIESELCHVCAKAGDDWLLP
jgi:ferredoxin